MYAKDWQEEEKVLFIKAVLKNWFQFRHRNFSINLQIFTFLLKNFNATHISLYISGNVQNLSCCWFMYLGRGSKPTRSTVTWTEQPLRHNFRNSIFAPVFCVWKTVRTLTKRCWHLWSEVYPIYTTATLQWRGQGHGTGCKRHQADCSPLIRHDPRLTPVAPSDVMSPLTSCTQSVEK